MSSMFAGTTPRPATPGGPAHDRSPGGPRGGATAAAISTWTVQIEARRSSEATTFDDALTDRLASRAIDVEASRDRYRLHFEVFAEDLAEATRVALGHWWHIVEVADLPDWEPSIFTVELAQDDRTQQSGTDQSAEIAVGHAHGVHRLAS